MPDSEEGTSALANAMTKAAANGMRATLATGSLITGSLYVALDVYPDDPPATVGTFAGRPTLPTVETGLAGLEQKVASLLAKISALPLEKTVTQATATLADLSALLASPEMRALPGSLETTLAELTNTLSSVAAESELQERLLSTLASLQELLDTLAEKPNALIFNHEPGADLEPTAGAP
jgi:paraquat-inducible protein B